MGNYRKLTVEEISTLVANGCSAADWADITVTAGFDASLISGCRFEGVVKIGARVTIKDVQDCIANYTIGDDVIICGVESLRTTCRSTFGNGTPVAVLNEAGGRQVKIYDAITAQTAYICAMYRHRPEVIKAIDSLIEKYVNTVESDVGMVGRGAKILNCGAMENIRIGEYALIRGAGELSNGTVNSSAEAPVYIGRDVIARDFIAATSAEISDGANIERCFVGQGSVISKGFTAVDSLFFANCQCLCGEAVSVFAGPYTVTHHKSTLLIGGMFSFYNAGSSTNMSNHYYRLGPVHQGVLERGTKTGSGSYMIFPSRVGAFSIVKGRLRSNIDTSGLPFSIIYEHTVKGSILIPAANLFKVGTVRDTMKWPQRDNRKGACSDLINYEMLSPYTISKIISAINILGDSGNVNGFNIPPKYIDRALKIYSMAIFEYIGNRIAARLEVGRADFNVTEIYDEWVDMAGFIAPVKVINAMLDKLESGGFETIEKLIKAIAHIGKSYEGYEWGYVANLVTSKLKRNPDRKDIRWLLEKWKQSVSETYTMVCNHAGKEFDCPMKISYGIDGDETVRDTDFANVRGSFEDNGFIKEFTSQYEKYIKTAEALIKDFTE